jgi:N-methylhydantoinase B/oxoprolinase/acetone carboxylase alpha subunit
VQDPFTIEILKDKLHAAADEMAVVLARTSMSPIAYEVLEELEALLREWATFVDRSVAVYGEVIDG